MTDSPPQAARADLLALLAGLVHEPYDPDLFNQPALDDVMESLERARAHDVALASSTLILPLLTEVAANSGELAEDVLRRVAMHAAVVPIPPANP